MADDTTEKAPKKPKSKAPATAAIEMIDQGAAVETPASEAAATAAQTLKNGASKLAKEATGKARDYLEEGKTRAGGALDEVSRMMGEAADTVDEKLGAQYGQYARTAADGIAGFSESLKAKEIEDLLADAQSFVRKSPAVAVGIAAALGFVVARLVKAGLEPVGADRTGPTDAAAPPEPTPPNPTAV